MKKFAAFVAIFLFFICQSAIITNVHATASVQPTCNLTVAGTTFTDVLANLKPDQQYVTEFDTPIDIPHTFDFFTPIGMTHTSVFQGDSSHGTYVATLFSETTFPNSNGKPPAFKDINVCTLAVP